MNPLNLVENNARLASILTQLSQPRHVLELGCGASPDALAFYSVNPKTLLLGVDRDPQALKQAGRHVPAARFMQADVGGLPIPLNLCFDRVIVRHPDIAKCPIAWKKSFTALPRVLSASGGLVVTTYTVPELEEVRNWLSMTTFYRVELETNRLAAPGLLGRDACMMHWCLLP